MNITELKTYFFTIEGAIVPKARPKFSGRQAYLPKRYRNWKQSAIDSIKSQLPPNHQPLERCGIAIQLHGSHRGDADNIFGALADALVQAGVILDDRLSVLSAIELKHIPDRSRFAQITVAEFSA